MSYNITRFKTKKLKDFEIPMRLFSDRFWFDAPKLSGGDIIRIDSMESDIEGVLIGNNLEVTHIRISDEGSGSLYDVLLPIFRESTGLLEAVLVWEGGDSITSLKVKNGKVTEKKIEL